MGLLIRFIDNLRNADTMLSFRRFALINASICIYSMHDGAIMPELITFFEIQRLFTFTVVSLYIWASLALNQRDS